MLPSEIGASRFSKTAFADVTGRCCCGDAAPTSDGDGGLASLTERTGVCKTRGTCPPMALGNKFAFEILHTTKGKKPYENMC